MVSVGFHSTATEHCQDFPVPPLSQVPPNMRQRTPLRHYAAQSRNRASPMRFKNRYLSLQLFLNPIPQLDPKQRIHAVALDRAAGINILDALRQYRQRFRELPDQRLDDDVRGVGKGGGVREQGTGILLFSLDFARSTTFGRSGSDFVCILGA